MTVGFVGLGRMGRPIAWNLLRGDALAMVASRSATHFAEFEFHGVRTSSVTASVAIADVIFLCLPDEGAVRETLLGQNGLRDHLRDGQIVVDLSTIAPSFAIDMAAALQDAGAHYVDAPISGMVSRAEAGTLTIMCGGSALVVDEIRPLLDLIARECLHMGPSGSGQLAKLFNQLLFDINMAALAEVLPVATKLGLDPESVGRVINGGTGRSYASEFFVPRILEGRFSEGYPMNAAYKDLRHGAELAARLGAPMPVLAAATTTYQTALLEGHGAEDKGAMVRVFERLLGAEFRGSAACSGVRLPDSDEERVNG